MLRQLLYENVSKGTAFKAIDLSTVPCLVGHANHKVSLTFTYKVQ